MSDTEAQPTAPPSEGTDPGDLIGLREANEQLGLGRWSTQLEKLEKQGQVALVRIDKGGRTYVYITTTELERARSSGLIKDKPPRTRAPNGGAKPMTDADPLAGAILDLETAVKALKDAVKEHDRKTRLDTIVNIAESLQEGVKR